MRVTPAEFSRSIGVSRAAVTQAKNDGRIVVGEDGKLDLDEARQRFFSTRSGAGAQNGKANGGATHDDLAPGGPSYSIGRAVRETYLAKQARLDYEARVGNLLEAEDVRRQVFDLARRARNAMLAIPARVSAILAAEVDPTAIEERLRLEIEAACAGVAEPDVKSMAATTPQFAQERASGSKDN